MCEGILATGHPLQGNTPIKGLYTLASMTFSPKYREDAWQKPGPSSIKCKLLTPKPYVLKASILHFKNWTHLNRFYLHPKSWIPKAHIQVINQSNSINLGIPKEGRMTSDEPWQTHQTRSATTLSHPAHSAPYPESYVLLPNPEALTQCQDHMSIPSTGLWDSY